MTKAKSIIILCIGDSPFSKILLLIDDNAKSAKELWDELEKNYNARMPTQSSTSVKRSANCVSRKPTAVGWEEHVNKFMDLLGKLATYDEKLSDNATLNLYRYNDKGSKLLRTLPESFNGFEIIGQVQELKVEKVVKAMQAEISRRKSIKGSPSNDVSPKASTADKSSGKKDRHFRDKGGCIGKHRHNDDRCYVCEKRGLFAID